MAALSAKQADENAAARAKKKARAEAKAREAARARAEAKAKKKKALALELKKQEEAAAALQAALDAKEEEAKAERERMELEKAREREAFEMELAKLKAQLAAKEEGGAPSEAPPGQVAQTPQKPAGIVSIDLSKLRTPNDDEDEDEDDNVDLGPIPDWARSDALRGALAEQAGVDPDRIFPEHVIGCDLEDIFAGYQKRTRFVRRTSSADWSKDRLTWKEESAYRRIMGYKS